MRSSLQLSKSLDNTPETRELLDKLAATKDSKQKVAQKQASLNKAKKRKRLKKHQAKETRKLLETTRQALLDDNLELAHETFNQLPSPANESSEVSALREELDRAVTTRVAQLTSRGDSEYRADNVDTAMKTWSEALELDPENQNLKERLERAGRVLARLIIEAHAQRPVVADHIAVQPGLRSTGLVTFHFDKTKALASTGKDIRSHANGAHSAIGGKHLVHGFFGGILRQITDKQLFHVCILNCAGGLSRQCLLLKKGPNVARMKRSGIRERIATNPRIPLRFIRATYCRIRA